MVITAKAFLNMTSKHPNTQALAAAATLAGAVFFGSPAWAQDPTPPATPPATPATPPATPPAAGETPPGTPPAAGESKIHAAPPAAPVQRRVTTPVIAAGAISIAALGTGIVFGILASGDNSKYKKSPTNDDALSGEKNAFISDVGFGVATLFGLTAIALYLLPDEPAPTAAAASGTPVAKTKSPRAWVTAVVKGEVLSF